MRLDGGSPSSHHAKWSLPPGRERLDPSTALDHVAVRLLVLGMLFVGFCVRGFANLALDAMSLFIIESKGWIVFLLGQGVIIWLIRERRDRVPQDSSIRKLKRCATLRIGLDGVAGFDDGAGRTGRERSVAVRN